MPTPPLADAPVHLVRVDRRGRVECNSLPRDALDRLEMALKVPWYRVRWGMPSVRTACCEWMRAEAPAGVVLIAPGVKFEIPPPFTYRFEPVQLGIGDPRLKTLSGEKPTSGEKTLKWFLRIGIVFLFLCVVGGVVAWFTGGQRIIGGVSAMVLVILATIPLAMWLSNARGVWFLTPASVSVVRRSGRQPIEQLTRYDACAVVRLVSNGKATYLQVELWRPDARPVSRPVSDREAMSFLAAWRSPVPPPPPERIAEFAGIGLE